MSVTEILARQASLRPFVLSYGFFLRIATLLIFASEGRPTTLGRHSLCEKEIPVEIKRFFLPGPWV
jgi:hypothetical protein